MSGGGSGVRDSPGASNGFSERRPLSSGRAFLDGLTKRPWGTCCTLPSVFMLDRKSGRAPADTGEGRRSKCDGMQIKRRSAVLAGRGRFNSGIHFLPYFPLSDRPLTRPINTTARASLKSKCRAQSPVFKKTQAQYL
ncbi:hypothetical protein SKAU_G00237180 [Synaphobranchus kaupii]|uniref:Uncharacterized protein n=1 Tax=Synaphobranchus kaupii TaxID=118154 RepID=A0A9Q1ITI4_SYNKA|nr:hypothetical protein SKAU_G00237180 [Synaphobranchus kaupii]